MHVDSLVGSIEVVSAADAALDMTKQERLAYALSRDPAKLREVPGRKAVRFVCRPLSSAEAGICESQPSADAKTAWAFMLGCAEVRHADMTGPAEGRAVKPTHPFEGPDGRKLIWHDREMTALQAVFGRRVFYEVGSVIRDRALLGNAAGGVLDPFETPQSLLDALDRIARHRAALLAATPTETPST